MPWVEANGISIDQVRPPEASERLAPSIPGARFELIDAVHMMPAQAPAALLALIEDFLGARHGGARAAAHQRTA